MKKITKHMMTLAGVLALGLVAARAQSDSALLDALVKKGVLSGKEADDIRADEANNAAVTPANKISVANYVKQIQFYGDGRLRYENIGQNLHYQNANTVVDRERYRLRFGLTYTYSDALSAGFELRSGTADDTANQSFGGMFTDASIQVSKIYLQYKPTDWATLIGGKFTNPLYTTTDMTWSNDLTPEGGAETFSYTIPLGGGSSTTVGDPKDVKSVRTVTSDPDSSLTIGLTAAQYIDINQNESNNSSPFSQNNNDVLIIANQIPVTWKVNKDITVKVVPGFTFYTGGGNMNYDSGVPVNQNNVSGVTPPAPGYVYGTANSSNDPVFYSPNEADDLNIVSAPGEVDYKIAKLPMRTYWDFDWNVTAGQRVRNVYLGPGGGSGTGPNGGGYGFAPTAPGYTAAKIVNGNQSLTDGVAWAIGEQIGQNKKKGDWSLSAEFRQLGLGSVDPNINGTDFANSYLNQQGVKIQGCYNFTDYLTGTITYYNDWDYKGGLYQALGGGGNALGGGSKPAPGTTQYLVSQGSTQRIQVDVGWKF